MFAKGRQDLIYEMILKNNTVTVASLVEKFAVSIETVRRDLLEMEKAGMLTRVHGGAVAKTGMNGFSALATRNTEHSEQKKALSLKACQFINEGDIIAVDAGSTATFFADALKQCFKKLTVLMNTIIPFCGSPYLMAGVCCVNGFAQSLMWPPLVRLMTTLLTDDDYKNVTAKVTWGGNIGTMLIYLLAPVIVSYCGWKWVFWFAAISGALMMVVWNRYSYEIGVQKRVKSTEEVSNEKNTGFSLRL